MAKQYEDKNGKRKPPKKAASPAFRFINYDLTAADRAWLNEADLETEFSVRDMLEEIETDYKLSVAHDVKHSCYIASLTDRSEGEGFENTCLTGRGKTPYDSLVSLWYRHVVLAKRDWSFYEVESKVDAGRFH